MKAMTCNLPNITLRPSTGNFSGKKKYITSSSYCNKCKPLPP